MEYFSQKQFELSEVFLKALERELTFREIKEITNINSVNGLHLLLKKLVKNNIIKEKHIGNTITYSINFSFESITYFSYVAQSLALRNKQVPINNLRKIFEKLNLNYLTILITGSYVLNKQTKMSDLDLVIICPNTLNPQKIEAEILTECELMIPNIHLMVFTEKQFLEMLLSKKENFGKEVVKKNLIYYGANNYLKLIKEAIENGWSN